MNSPARKTSRREFLAGRSVIQAVEDALPVGEAPRGSASVAGPRGHYLLQIGRPAMACDFDIFMNAGQHAGGTEAALAALDLVDQLEAQMTVYRETSEVIEINRHALLHAVPVERQLFQLLCLAATIHRETHGAFDITSGPLSKAWGFFRRAGRFPSPDEIAAALARVGSEWIQLDSQQETVRFEKPGLEMNLNAIGKGYALDRASTLLIESDIANFLIHGGQSSILARGSRATDDSIESGWLVSLPHPLRPERRLAELRLLDRALGTSGSGNQFFHFQGKRYGHVIDPRTGYPADQVLSVTVLAPNAATADALATAFFVMGVEESLELCSTHPELAAVFLVLGDRAGDIRIVTHGLTEEEFQVLSDP